MAEIKIPTLDERLIQQANFNSFGGTRGDYSKRSYESYCNKVLTWDISDEKKQKIIDQIHKRWCDILRQEAQHVSVAVAGPAKYNAKKLDHSDRILQLSHDFVDWFGAIEAQAEQSRVVNDDAEEIARLVDMIDFCDKREELNPTNKLCELATKDPAKFMELYEKLKDKYRWRKNSAVAKLYAAAQAGTLTVTKRETFFEDENLTAYTMGNRAYIRFTMKPAQQLIFALKSRKWWWNSWEKAWSTYLDKLDKDWVSSISERYAAYV